MSYPSSRLNMIMKECYARKDTSGALDAFNAYMPSQCYNPIKLRVYDSHTQMYTKRWFACGTCYHCMETKINSWVTRMYAHLEDFKNVYFITLTYRSISPVRSQEPSGFTQVSPLNQLLLQKLSNAVWHLDDKNYNKHLSYNPCLLCKEHYQNFLKRLRKNTGYKDITYVLCGEYGSTYGRPHFHMVLFSNHAITQAQVQRAWSISLWRDDNDVWTYRRNQKHNGVAFDFPIGKVDFNDLVSNGTLNTTAKVKVDGTFMNAANCFSYVCKYVCKQDSANFSRVLIAYNNLFINETMCNDPALGIQPLHVSLARLEHYYLLTLSETLKQNSYEEKIFFPSRDLAGTIHCNSAKSVCGKIVLVENYASDLQDFRVQFRPFVEVSRGCPIGSVYANTHLSEFAEGVFNKPLLQERGFIVPQYFRTKAQNYVYGLRKMRKTIRGVSYAKTGLLDLYGRFEESLCDDVPLLECVPSWQSCKPYLELLKDSTKVFRDLHDSTKVILCAGRAMSFRYNRHIRDYERVSQLPVAEWIKMQLERLSRDFVNYRVYERERSQTLKETESAFLNLAKTTHQSVKSLRRQFVERQNMYLSNKQLLYESTHHSLD